jgi:hypothetical protein
VADVDSILFPLPGDTVALDLDDFTRLVRAINRLWFEVAVLPPR